MDEEKDRIALPQNISRIEDVFWGIYGNNLSTIRDLLPFYCLVFND